MMSVKYKIITPLLLAVLCFIILSACNKQVEQFSEAAPVTPTGQALGEKLASTPNDSLYYRLIVTAGLQGMINNKSTAFTMFVPDNNAMKIFINALSGGLVPLAAPDAVFSGFITANISKANAAGIVSYNIVPQALPSASIPSTFPNFQYPTILNPAPSVSALLRLTTFPTTRNGAWINNIPLTGAAVAAANGLIYQSAFLVTPPQRFLWDRINTDPGLTYLKAAIIRADSGLAATAPTSLVGALNNIGANLTVFAPTDSAFKAGAQSTIKAGLVAMGVPVGTADIQATFLASTPDVFNNPLLFSVLTAETVKGLIVYHILGSRAFTNNISTTPINSPTLLNSAISIHPGVTLQAIFGGAPAYPFATSATVKGAANATPSNIIINSSPLLPDPFGTSDQHYLNGVLHKIDQVMRPL